MKKVINITIGKTVFMIEDDAYQKLDNYLSGIREYFTNTVDGDEVVEDIENSIAEKFVARGNDASTSINSQDVEAIVAEMGTVEELAGETDNEPVDEDSESKPTGAKRLYRDTDDVIIGGVASGIAKYFNIDPVIVRIAFVIVGVFGGFGIPAYILLWIIVSPADTAAKQIHMQGGSATLSEIETFVKKKIDEVPQSNLKKALSFPFLILKKFFQFIKIVVLKTGPLLAIIIGGAIIIASLAGLFAFSTSFVALLSGGVIADPILALIIGIAATGLLGIVTLLSVYLIIVVPLVTLTFLGVAFARRKKVLGWIGFTTLFVIWFIAANIVAGTAISHLDEIRSGIDDIQDQVKESYVEQSYDNLIFDSVDIEANAEVHILQGDTYSVVVEGSEKALESLRVDDEDKTLHVYRDHRFYVCIFSCSDVFSRTIITITTPELLEIDFSGSITGDMGEFKTDDFTARFSGSAKFNVNVISDSLELRSLGSSVITLTGEANILNMRLSGSSRIDAYNMSVYKATVRSSGSARVNLHVIETLDVHSSGSTKVSYINAGDVVVTKRISGSGSVTEITLADVEDET